MAKGRAIIVGAGLTGLSAAYHLKKLGVPFEVFEKEAEPGGLCRSKKVDAFTFDYAEHFLRTPDAVTEAFFSEIMDERLRLHRINSSVYISGRHYGYPFQKNLFGLPPGDLKECIAGFVEGCMRRAAGERAHNFEEWILLNLGRGIASLFMLPYNEKIWTVPPRELSIDWFFSDSVVPVCTIEEVLDGALLPEHERRGPPDTRWYPDEGGCGAIAAALAARVGPIKVGVELKGISPEKRLARFSDGSALSYAVLLSTIPLPELVRLTEGLPDEVRDCAAQLRHNSVLCLNLGLSKPDSGARHWVYFPERQFIFPRVYFPSNCSKSMAPEGKSSISAIITHRGGLGPSDEEIYREVVLGLIDAHFIENEGDIITRDFMHIPYGFPIPDIGARERVSNIRRCLEPLGIITAGRYGAWEYSGMEHAVAMGKESARAMAATCRDG